jgi:hypothetical protein
MTHSTTAAAHAEDAHHPGWKTYTLVAVILFVLTALEVGLYEVAHRGGTGAFAAFATGMFTELLLVLSAAKFALVAMFYMHLKQDSKIFSSLFVFPLIIAIIIILALFALFVYNHGQNAIFGMPPWGR